MPVLGPAAECSGPDDGIAFKRILQNEAAPEQPLNPAPVSVPPSLCAVKPPDAIRKILDCPGLPSRPSPSWKALAKSLSRTPLKSGGVCFSKA
jgi:hypothetical protein